MNTAVMTSPKRKRVNLSNSAPCLRCTVRRTPHKTQVCEGCRESACVECKRRFVPDRFGERYCSDHRANHRKKILGLA